MLTIIKNYILLGKNCNFQLYWSVSFGRNDFSAPFSTCPAIISNSFSVVFMLKFLHSFAYAHS